eukprot:NODE_103_length_3653_cov_3.168179.p1 GENE.NODE_103_length_3653_cov_3.168179~~NODE_103_length_3653_cov_3.168179.p1  ORF type:complete len:109 (-),score=2.61 NODE_103_length_3653_cov_3.168179:1280-1606(-)
MEFVESEESNASSSKTTYILTWGIPLVSSTIIVPTILVAGRDGKGNKRLQLWSTLCAGAATGLQKWVAAACCEHDCLRFPGGLDLRAKCSGQHRLWSIREEALNHGTH